MARHIHVDCEQNLHVPSSALKFIAEEFVEWLNDQQSI